MDRCSKPCHNIHKRIIYFDITILFQKLLKQITTSETVFFSKKNVHYFLFSYHSRQIIFLCIKSKISNTDQISFLIENLEMLVAST